VEDGDLISEDLVKIGGNGRSETDLGNKEYGGASGFEDGTHRREIDRRFAGASYAVQKHSREFLGRDVIT
jgi:hypothetical protein